MRILVLLLAGLVLSGCLPGYTLVSPSQVAVSNGTMKVKPTKAWNKAPIGPYDTPAQESWTENGPLLDTVTFFGAVEPGQAMAKQKPKDDRQVPVFRADMTPQDLASMIESYYRIKVGATIFETTTVKPATFLGKPGMQVDYNYIPPDEVKRRGRVVLAVVDGKLYLMALDCAALHYFDATLPEFEAMLTSAVIS